jgi:molybdate transport system permease protein
VTLLAALDLAPLWLSFELAAVTTLVLLAGGTPLAWWLARTRARVRPLVDALVGMPLVLPPTVLGFYLLFLLGPNGPIGGLWESLGGQRLVFSFAGLVVGSVVFSLPFVVQPLKNAFAAIGERPLEVAATLGAGPLDRFCSVVVPAVLPSFATAATLGFAHTVGEFGVVLMIGGNVPGQTNVASIAIYDRVERMDYGEAHALAAILLGFSFAVLVAVQLFDRRKGPMPA